MKDKKAIAVFLLITVVLSGVCWFVRIVGGDSVTWILFVLMWCPGVAAIITKRIFYHRQKILGFHKSKIKYILAGIIIPIAYLGLSYGIYWFIDKSALSEQVYTAPLPNVLLSLLLSFILGLLPASLLALGEEIGWRGFLLPKMSEIWNVRTATIMSGAIWAVWHFPLMIAGIYQAGTPIWYQLPMFTAELIAMTGILAFLRLKSNSVWPAVIFHASHNVFDQSIMAPLTIGERSAYFAGETGIITVVVSVILLIILWGKQKSAARV